MSIINECSTVAVQMIQLQACAALEAAACDNAPNTRMILERGGLENVSQCSSMITTRDLIMKMMAPALGRPSLFQNAQNSAHMTEGGVALISRPVGGDDAAAAPLKETLNRLVDMLKRASNEQAGAASGAASSAVEEVESSRDAAGQSGARTPGSQRKRDGRVDEVCMACGKNAADVGVAKLLKCSGCTNAPRYCSAECQRACWGAHKAECKANKKKPSK